MWSTAPWVIDEFMLMERARTTTLSAVSPSGRNRRIEFLDVASLCCTEIEGSRYGNRNAAFGPANHLMRMQLVSDLVRHGHPAYARRARQAPHGASSVFFARAADRDGQDDALCELRDQPLTILKVVPLCAGLFPGQVGKCRCAARRPTFHHRPPLPSPVKSPRRISAWSRRRSLPREVPARRAAWSGRSHRSSSGPSRRRSWFHGLPLRWLSCPSYQPS